MVFVGYDIVEKERSLLKCPLEEGGSIFGCPGFQDDSNMLVFIILFIEVVLIFAIAVWQMYKRADALFPLLSMQELTGASCQSPSDVSPSIGLAILHVAYGILHMYENITQNFMHDAPFVEHKQLRFFTVWNYILQNVYVILAGTVMVMPLIGKQQPPDWMRRAILPLFNLNFPMSCFISVIYWGLLAGPDAWKNRHMILQHLVNTVFFIIVFIWNRLLIVLEATTLAFILGAVYVLFTWAAYFPIVNFVEMTRKTMLWPYFFMVLADWLALAWYNGLILGLGAVMMIFWFLSTNTKGKCIKGSMKCEYSGGVSAEMAFVITPSNS